MVDATPERTSPKCCLPLICDSCTDWLANLTYKHLTFFNFGGAFSMTPGKCTVVELNLFAS